MKKHIDNIKKIKGKIDSDIEKLLETMSSLEYEDEMQFDIEFFMTETDDFEKEILHLTKMLLLQTGTKSEK